MRTENQHIIQKQTIEIEFENIDDSFGVQDRVAQVFYENLQPQMDILFDEMFGKDTFVSIDKLEIDCGILSIENWEQEFAAQAIPMLKEGLVQVNRKTVDVKVTEETTATETFFFFLENGFLPWNKRIESVAELERILKVDEKWISRLKKQILQNPNVAKRLAFQFSAEFNTKLITAFTQNRKHETEILLSIHQKVNSLESVKHGQDQIVKQVLIETILTVFASKYFKNLELEFFTFLLSKVENNDHLKTEIREIQKKIQALSDKRRLATEENLLESERIKIREKSSKQLNESNQEVYKETKNKKHIRENIKTDDAIYIENAGLVLLHPFLPALFANLKLVEQNTWINEASKQKAVLSMEFLVTGKDETEEFDLVLNKILCGIEIDDVVPTSIRPDEVTKTECDVLLMELIKHWDVLKNTRIAGLREGFLQRHGKLSRVDDGWLLQVEQKAIDVLLNHLPWGIGIIKLPWMNEMLVVEWT